MRKFVLAFASCLWLPGVALAHEGHGLGGTHWHATDVLGFIAVGAGVAWLIWQQRK